MDLIGLKQYLIHGAERCKTVYTQFFESAHCYSVRN